MKHFITPIFLLFVFFFSSVGAQAQTYNWVKGGGSASSLSAPTKQEATYKMCTDPHGNIYALNAIGYAAVSADTFTHSAASWSNDNALFTSYDCNGNMRFAKFITCMETHLHGVVADSFGNIYLALALPHTSTGARVLRIGDDTTITGYTYGQQALIKYDTSGHLKWLRFVGDNTLPSFYGTGGEGNLLALDNAQNPHLIIWNYPGLVFRPGDTSKKGATDLRYDPVGNLITVKHINLDTLLGIQGATIDPQSNKLYAYGENGSFSYKFLAAFDTNRNLIWIDTLTNPASITYGFTGVAADGIGHLYVSAQGAGGSTIYRNDTVGNDLSSSGAAYKNFILKTDTAGNVLWTTNFSGTSLVGLVNIILAPSKRKLALVGSLLGKVKCDIDSTQSYAGEADNPVFTVLDTAGYVHELQQLHAPSFYDWANVPAMDRVGNLYVGGQVVSTVWGGSLSPYTSVGGDTDFFITKYGVDCNCPAMPVSNFTYTLTGTTTVNFTYTGSPGDSVRWYFGDGTPISTSLTPSHVFSSTGTFTVRCWVYTGCGRDLKGTKVVIPCTYPGGASFTHSGVSSLSFNYTGSTISVDSIRWRFGDGGTSTLTNPTHSYTAPGTYNVCVKVYSWCMVDSFCTSITVPCVTAPVAALSASGTGATRNFTYTGTTTGVTSISWDYGDGSGTGSGSTTSHTYPAIGIYTVCVTATSPCGSNVICATVNVTCMATPVALFNKSGSMAVRSFGYTGTVTGADSIVWNFGDGGHATGMSPSHTYATTGVFTVCVTAYSQCGNSTWCDTVNVPCLAIPSVTFTSTSGIHDATKNFSYTASTVGVDSVRWSFGDGAGFTGSSATHTYSDTGSYTVCAIAYSQCGNDTTCSTIIYRLPLGVTSMFSDNVRVYPNPTSGQLVIENAKDYICRIADVVDREVYSVRVSGLRQTIDISSFAGGLYIVQLTNNRGERMTVKLIKQ